MRDWFLPLVAAGAAIAYWLRLPFDSGAALIAVKMMPALAMAGHVAWQRGSTAWAMIAALMCHAAGDGLLNFGADSLLAGMAMFFLGHLAYIAAYYPRRLKLAEVSSARRAAILVVIAATIVLLVYLWPRLSGVMAFGVPIYSAVLAAMAIAALVGRWIGPLVMIGAVLFVFSDAVLGLKLFAGEKSLASLVWPSYATAQIMMPLGYLRSVAMDAATPGVKHRSA